MKNKKIFISYSYSDEEKYQKFHENLKKLLKINNNEIYSFVFDNKEKFKNDKEMMTEALNRIKKSDILIAEISNKKIGIGLEVGYAKALKKKIVYLYKKDSEYSTTVGGVADLIIKYETINDLKKIKFLNKQNF